MASETSEQVIVDFANSNTSNNNTVTASTRFRWDKEQKVENLIRCLANYKAKMEFSNKDFNADKVQQFEEVRKGMACIYEHQPSHFGSESLNSDVSSNDLKIQKGLIKKGYQGLHEKIEELRQNFQNILAGRRSGSAKISDRYYEDLLQIWGCSPCAEALPFGASTSDINFSIQTGTSSSTSSDNNTTGVSSCSEDNSSIFNTSSVRLSQQHGSIINSIDDVGDYSVSDDIDNNKNETIIKNLQKKEKPVILLLLLVKI